jgi:PST family polysaccharide transporter
VIKKLKTLTKNENNKKLFANFTSLSVLRGFELIIPLITMPYLVRVIGIKNFGLVNFALSLGLYFGAIIHYGFGITATREIARNRNNPKLLSQIYSCTFTASILLSLASTVVFTTIVLIFDRFYAFLWLYLFTILFIVFQSLFPIWFFKGMERMNFITYLSLGAKTLFLISLFLLLTEEQDYCLVPLLNAISALMSLLLSTWLISKHFKVQYKIPSLTEIKEIYSSGRYVFISQLAPNLYNNSATLLLGLFTNTTIVGFYTAATKVIGAINSLAYILSNTFLPYLSRDLYNHKVFQKIMLSIGFGLTSLTLLFAENIVNLLFTSENIIVTEYIQWLSISILMIFISLTYGTNYLMLVGKEKLVKNVYLYTSVTFFIIANIVIPLLGIWGAILTLVGARFVMAALNVRYYLLYRN